MNGSRRNPPRFAERLLQRTLRSRARRYMVADLAEEYAARRTSSNRFPCDVWYWWESLRLIARLLPIRRPPNKVLPRRETDSMFDTLKQDVAYAVRTLARSRTFTLSAVATLAIGVAASTAIFSVVYGVLQALPYPGGDRFVLIYEGDQTQRGSQSLLTIPEIAALEELEGSVFERVSSYSYRNVTMTGDPNPILAPAVAIAPDFQDLLDSPASLGRGFRDSDTDDASIVVLGYDFWQRQFGGDPDVVGTTVVLNDVSHRIVGVSAPGFTYFNDTNRIFLPLLLDPAQPGASRHNTYALARVRDDLDFATAEARVAAAVGRAQEATEHRPDAPRDIWMHSLYDAWVGSVQSRLLMLLGAVGILVMIACSNVASLQLARGLGRSREIAVRVALGGGRWRIMRQLFTESVILAVAGGAAGLGLAWLSLDRLRELVQVQLPRTENIQMNLTVLVFCFAVSAAAAVGFGLLPAWVVSGRDPARPLRGERQGAAHGGGRIRSGLLVAQIALAVILAVGAGLLSRSFGNLQSRPLGFQPGDVYMTGLFVGSRPEYRDPDRVRAFYSEVAERVEAIPGVVGVGAISTPPGWTNRVAGDFVARTDGALPTPAQIVVVTPGALETLRVQTQRGRLLRDTDGPHDSPVVVVNEAFAERFWPGSDAIGQLVRPHQDDVETTWATVVGVIGNIRQTSLHDPDEPRIYMPLTQRAQPFMTLLTRVTAPDGFAERVREAVAEVDPGQTVVGPGSMAETLDRYVVSNRVNAWLVSLFASIGLLLAALGEYAVVQYSVMRRTPELGVRMALGAPAGRVLALVVRNGVALAILGLLIGFAGAWAASRSLDGLLHDVPTTDVFTYASVAALLLGVAVAASWIPARRAAAIDPVAALRGE
ncbi:MAG: FtsX-like permease family protein [Acidobacteria bacterium]|nr:FtsX-like permease family protein [Acidobacteriota bacterium]